MCPPRGPPLSRFLWSIEAPRTFWGCLPVMSNSASVMVLPAVILSKLFKLLLIYFRVMNSICCSLNFKCDSISWVLIIPQCLKLGSYFSVAFVSEGSWWKLCCSANSQKEKQKCCLSGGAGFFFFPQSYFFWAKGWPLLILIYCC